MSRKLLIESAPLETRVALLDGRHACELHIEHGGEGGEVGNIYKGRVTRVVPGIQAAFVDLGLDRDAFLFAGNLRPADDEPEESNDETRQGDRHAPTSITDIAKQGEELVVQVIKESLPGKGARVTTEIALPGRLIVLLPAANGVGLSRRIDGAEERQRLARLLEENRPARGGIIARTVAAGRSSEELAHEIHVLEDHWRELQDRSAGCPAPALLHEEPELALRAVRDLLDNEVEQVWVEGAEAHSRIIAYLQEADPRMVERVQLHDGEDLLFDHFGIEKEVEKALGSRVWLESGGHIVVSPTEALVAIDVNTGSHTGTNDLEQTVLQTNLEAAAEVARQIRLRDLGGIIVVDFIDLIEAEHRQRVLAALEEELGKDRTRTRVAGFSEFGLVEVTRKRARGGLQQRSTRPCPCCSGQGRVKTPATLAQELRRELQRRRLELLGREVRLRVHPSLAAALQGDHRQVIEEAQRRLEAGIRVEGDSELRRDEFAVLVD